MRNSKIFQIILILVVALIIPVQSLATKNYKSGNVEVDILSDQRGALQKFAAGYGKGGAERSYVIARNDERYSIRVSNRSNERVGVVVAVDGRNILSGHKSHLEFHERMYILEPYQTHEYEGWRTGRNQINRFHFTGMNNSYAANWGDYSAMGTVAVAVFGERHHQGNRNGKRNKGFGRSKAMRGAPGTGFGEREWSPSKDVHFAAQKRPVEKTLIKYESRSTLCSNGIIECRPKHKKNRSWQRHGRNNGYAPYPSWSFQLRF